MNEIIYELSKGRMRAACVNKYIETICNALLYVMEYYIYDCPDIRFVEPDEKIVATSLILQKILDAIEEPHNCIDSPRTIREFIIELLTYEELKIVVDSVKFYNTYKIE